MGRARRVFYDNTQPWDEEIEGPIEELMLQEFDGNYFGGHRREDHLGTLKFRHRNRQHRRFGGRHQWN